MEYMVKKRGNLWRSALIWILLLSVSSLFIWTDAASAKSLLHEKSILKKQEQLKKENETEDISLNQTETLELKTGEKPLKVTKPSKEKNFAASSVNSSDDQVFNNESSLSDSNPDDLWLFSTTSDNTLLTRMLSDNTDYYLQLYVVDWDTGQATPSNIIKSAGDLVVLKELPAGDYLIRVASNGATGDKYRIQLNAKNPANFTSVKSVTSTLQQFVAGYEDGSIYANGTYMYNEETKTASFSWERVFYFSYGDGYNQRTHSISSVKVKNISAPITYSSSYAGSSSAIMVYLDVNTLFMHHVSAYKTGQGYQDSFADTLGKTTPRRLDTDDLNNYGDHILIVDLKTGKAIDFFSVLNYYYASGVERIPTIQYIN